MNVRTNALKMLSLMHGTNGAYAYNNLQDLRQNQVHFPQCNPKNVGSEGFLIDLKRI